MSESKDLEPDIDLSEEDLDTLPDAGPGEPAMPDDGDGALEDDATHEEGQPPSSGATRVKTGSKRTVSPRNTRLEDFPAGGGETSMRSTARHDPTKSSPYLQAYWELTENGSTEAAHRLEKVQRHLSLPDDDPMWALFVALEWHHALYNELPERIQDAASVSEEHGVYAIERAREAAKRELHKAQWDDLGAFLEKVEAKHQARIEELAKHHEKMLNQVTQHLERHAEERINQAVTQTVATARKEINGLVGGGTVLKLLFLGAFGTAAYYLGVSYGAFWPSALTDMVTGWF